VLWLQFVGVAARWKGRRIASRCGRRPPALMPAGHEGQDPASGRWLGIAPEWPAPRQRKSAAPSPASRQHGQDSTTKAARQRSATASWSDQQCRERECRQYPGLRERGRRRTRQDQIPNWPEGRLWNCGALIQGAAPNEENLFLLPDRTLTSEPVKADDPTVDLMSRRHPLSSTRTF
jgi:hypothetical protein